jgi:hypothetical protein
MELWLRIVTIVLWFFVIVRTIRYMSELPNSNNSVTTGATLFQKPHKHPPALPPNRLKLKNNNIRIITHIALILSGDIQLNPGPCSTIYPCGICEHPVTWSDVGPCCDGCNIWYHKSCIDLCTAELDSIGKDNVVWLCCKCETLNHSSTLFHAFEIDLHNNYSILNDLNNNSTVSSITSPKAIFQPQTHSSPNTPRRTKTTGSRNYVKKLARKAYPGVEGGLRDTLTKDAFIDALNDRDIEWFVR